MATLTPLVGPTCQSPLSHVLSLSTRLVPPPPATSHYRCWRLPDQPCSAGIVSGAAASARRRGCHNRAFLILLFQVLMPLAGTGTNQVLQRVARRPPARLPVPMLVPAMELLGTDTAHRTTGRSRRGSSLHEAQTKISRNLLPICLPHLAARQQDSGTLIAGRIGARDLPPPQIRTGIPQHQLPSVQQLPNRKHTTQERQRRHELQLEKRKKRDLFCPVLHRKQRLGWGTWEWDQNRTLPPEIARRRLSGDLPLRSCSQ